MWEFYPLLNDVLQEPYDRVIGGMNDDQNDTFNLINCPLLIWGNE